MSPSLFTFPNSLTSWCPCPKMIWNRPKLILSTKSLSWVTNEVCKVPAIDILKLSKGFLSRSLSSPPLQCLPILNTSLIPLFQELSILHLFLSYVLPSVAMSKLLYFASLGIKCGSLTEICSQQGWCPIHILSAFTSLMTENNRHSPCKAFFLDREQAYRLSQKSQRP